MVGPMKTEEKSQPFQDWNPKLLVPPCLRLMTKGRKSKQNSNVDPANVQGERACPSHFLLKTEGSEEPMLQERISVITHALEAAG